MMPYGKGNLSFLSRDNYVEHASPALVVVDMVCKIEG
jgi:hypothetical protein